MRELTGSNHRTFATSSESLVEAMQDATNAIAGITLMDPTAVVRVMVKQDSDGIHDVLLFVEGR